MIDRILRLLRSIEPTRLNFYLGFLAGILFAWVISRLRVIIPQARDWLRNLIKETRQSLVTSTETRLRNDTVRMAQRMHLASPLFALDEVLIPPHLIAPPPPPQPGNDEPDDESIDRILPYLPDWPEMAATYHAPLLTLPEAMQGGANLILIGNPGSGKTVALASLASKIARAEAEVGELGGSLPVFIHAADLHFTDPASKDLLTPLIEAVAQNVSALTLPRLPNLIKGAFEKGSALLLLDGLDELPQEPIDKVIGFLKVLYQKYPRTRAIIAMSPEYYSRMTSMQFIPVAISAWTELDRANFIRHWGDLWQRYINPPQDGSQEQDNDDVNSLLLNGWLLTPDPSFTPLELTLKTWAAYAGDAQGPTAPDAIEAYLLRMTAGITKARPFMERLASQMTISRCPYISIKEAQKSLPEVSQSVSPFDESAPLSEEGEHVEETEGIVDQAVEGDIARVSQPSSKPVPAQAAGQAKGSKPAVGGQFTAQQVIPRLVECGLLMARKDMSISFNHPVIAGYLAGTALASSGDIEKLNNQPEWAGKSLAMRYLSHWNDLTDIVMPMIEDREDPLFRKLVMACKWLRDTSNSARWRTLSMRNLASIIQRELLPMGLRARAVTALISSGDPGVPVLLRSLLSDHQESVRRLAALGCGLARDAKSVNDLVRLLEDKERSVAQAAILALVAIGTKPALDTVASALLQGTEELRRAAAEALANHPEEGHPALADGSTMPDLLVRRAVVFGLARVGQPWARQTLEKMQIEDGQWVVRNAATQVLEDLKKPNPHIPQPLPDLTQLPWLIVFAGKEGVGVTPGKPAMDLVISAMRSKDRKEQMAAIYTLSLKGDISATRPLYQFLYGGDVELQDGAYQALWHMAASGVLLPPPAQFGLGYYNYYSPE